MVMNAKIMVQMIEKDDVDNVMRWNENPAESCLVVIENPWEEDKQNNVLKQRQRCYSMILLEKQKLQNSKDVLQYARAVICDGNPSWERRIHELYGDDRLIDIWVPDVMGNDLGDICSGELDGRIT